MKFTLSWLKKYLDTNSTLEQIEKALTNCGLEVEEITNRGQALSGFIVAEITNCRKAEGSSKLNICEVNTGTKKLQIICGGANASAGIKVVLAPVGSIVPNGGFKIKASNIRGFDSYGMLCSSSELNLGGLLPCPENGIIELGDECEVGAPISRYYGLDDPIIHINITPNRADALGVYGIAKDLAACGIGALKPLKLPNITSTFKSDYSIEVESSTACPYFSCYELKNIDNKPSPLWLQNWLLAIGIKPISAIVDVTNYISYSFGQPMHVYDASKIHGGLRVAPLSSAAKFRALNDEEYELQAGDLLISDKAGALHCLAGIIGGSDSSVQAGVSSILLEAAVFNCDSITKSGRKHNIDTDSRYRFERYVNSEFTPLAIEIAAQMILDICGGEASHLIEVGTSAQEPRMISMPFSFFKQRMGYDISKQSFEEILRSLGFKLEHTAADDSYIITVPASRYDVTIKEDILEEVSRIEGYDNIPVTPLSSDGIMAKIIPPVTSGYRLMQRYLASIGYLEAICYSFTSSKIASYFTSLTESRFIRNPISLELNYMRPSIAPCMLQIAANNLARGQENIALFELGPIFGEEESASLCAIRTGKKYANNWHQATRDIDAYDIKSELELTLAQTGLDPAKLRLNQEGAADYYHPTRSATLSLGKNIIATFGEVHPSTLELFGIKQALMMFEINLDNLPLPRAKFGRRQNFEFSNIQPIWRDYAFILPDAKPASELVKAISGASKLIKSTEIFDIYTGDELGDGYKSIALRVKIHNTNKTLAEEDIKPIHEAIIAKAEGIGAKLRGN